MIQNDIEKTSFQLTDEMHVNLLRCNLHTLYWLLFGVCVFVWMLSGTLLNLQYGGIPTVYHKYRSAVRSNVGKNIIGSIISYIIVLMRSVFTAEKQGWLHTFVIMSSIYALWGEKNQCNNLKKKEIYIIIVKLLQWCKCWIIQSGKLLEYFKMFGGYCSQTLIIYQKIVKKYNFIWLFDFILFYDYTKV